MTELTTPELETLLDQLHTLTLQRQAEIQNSRQNLIVNSDNKVSTYPVLTTDSDFRLYVAESAIIPQGSTITVGGCTHFVTGTVPRAGRQLLQILPTTGTFVKVQVDHLGRTAIIGTTPFSRLNGKYHVSRGSISPSDIIQSGQGPLFQVASVTAADNGLDIVTITDYAGGAK